MCRLSAETASREAHALLLTGLERPLKTKGEYDRSMSPWLSTTENPGPFDKMNTVQTRGKLAKLQANATLLHLLQLRKVEREDRKARVMERGVQQQKKNTARSFCCLCQWTASELDCSLDKLR